MVYFVVLRIILSNLAPLLMRIVSTGRPRSPGNISHLDDDSLVGLYLACRVPGISRKEGGGRVGYWRQEEGWGRGGRGYL